MKTTSLLALAATILVAPSSQAGTKISVPVVAYQAADYKNPPAHFKVNASAFRELDRDPGSSLSWVWFGGEIANQTSSDASYELVVSFFNAKGEELGGTTFKGTVKGRDSTTVPEKQTVMDASLVKQIYTAKYLLILK